MLVTVFQVRLSIAKGRWEKNFDVFLGRCAANSENDSLESSCVTYCCHVPGMKKEYHGEAQIGVKRRVLTHMRDMWRRKKRLFFHKNLAKKAHAALWMVTHAWNNQVTKVERLRKEGSFIWRRNSFWNCDAGAANIAVRKADEPSRAMRRRRRGTSVSVDLSRLR